MFIFPRQSRLQAEGTLWGGLFMGIFNVTQSRLNTRTPVDLTTSLFKCGFNQSVERTRMENSPKTAPHPYPIHAFLSLATSVYDGPHNSLYI